MAKQYDTLVYLALKLRFSASASCCIGVPWCDLMVQIRALLVIKTQGSVNSEDFLTGRK